MRAMEHLEKELHRQGMSVCKMPGTRNKEDRLFGDGTQRLSRPDCERPCEPWHNGAFSFKCDGKPLKKSLGKKSHIICFLI